ncbi:hypothetical protein [Micromonospora eburnea]|uniref:NnrS protein n=1 Tax=Micromonospora eburnea TaxID=227316 RepID=A0A1C6UX30_9ACTN|nr:hypothetical protein [Micromonospora eburnea]SCL58558.1 hypothetical protein GA0070604_3860 [Micromonospora eburnea]
MTARPGPLRWRIPVLAAGGFALLTGLYAALLLLDLPLPAPAAPLEQVHGPLMVLGFVGTLVALERAVALGSRRALLAPACSGAGAVTLVLTGPTLAGRLLLMLAGVLLLLIYRRLWQRQPGASLLAQGLGAFAWYAATLLWLAGSTVPEIVPWLATFVVATIAGERLELAHLALPRHGVPWFSAALGVLTAGATASTLWPAAGTRLFGVGLLATVGWLAVYDVARRTVRGVGLPRYVAAGLLAGYAWLALAGLLWAGAGPATGGPRYDATLHALFLGFTMSMIFVHAPVILPAVLRRPLPYRPWLYAPLALLHASLLARVVVGDGLGVQPVWRVAGTLNVLAVLAFLACAVIAMRGAPGGRGRPGNSAGRAPARPVAPAAAAPAAH